MDMTSGYDKQTEPTFIAIEIREGRLSGAPRPWPGARLPSVPEYRAVVTTLYFHYPHLGTQWTESREQADADGHALVQALREEEAS